jgi:predicted O-methyltransferase YrrM
VKHGTGLILRPAQERYLDRLLPSRDPLLAEIEQAAERDDVPISDPEVGRLLELVARATGARRILEVGTALGYGTLCLARGAPEARVVSVDHDPGMLERARGYLERGGVAGRVELVEGSALEVVAGLSGPFDLVWVDFVKTQYRRCLDLVLPKTAVGGTLLFDNLLWGGRVADPPDDEDDEAADALRSFNGYLMSHPQLRAVVMPLGDGVGIATKTRPLISELGGPFPVL